ncbi:hypothetical protein [Streptomyces sp. NPDC048436]|uniref:hypothetical protein n=1 Tax=Streptomyces sp. NPDC048436 TaxID=3365550 RepID=UPI00371CD8D5
MAHLTSPAPSGPYLRGRAEADELPVQHPQQGAPDRRGPEAVRSALLVPYSYGRVAPRILASIAADPSAAYLAGRSDSPAQAIERFAELVFGSVARSVAMDSEQVVPPPGGGGAERSHEEDY